jgi:hypothetical protein
MAASNKSGLGLVIVGFTFAASGVTFSATGNSAIGIPILAVGVGVDHRRVGNCPQGAPA